jgi:hypothetical protein
MSHMITFHDQNEMLHLLQPLFNRSTANTLCGISKLYIFRYLRYFS